MAKTVQTFNREKGEWFIEYGYENIEDEKAYAYAEEIQQKINRGEFIQTTAVRVVEGESK